MIEVGYYLKKIMNIIFLYSFDFYFVNGASVSILDKKEKMSRQIWKLIKKSSDGGYYVFCSVLFDGTINLR